MENSDHEAGVKLHISFPKSNEDHRLQLIKINDSIFAIVHAPLESNGPINLNCAEWSLILLAPIKSKADITISAINVICLNEIESEGNVNIYASNRLLKFLSLDKLEKLEERADGGDYQFEDDPGNFLSIYKLFNTILIDVHREGADAFMGAQQTFIALLCRLAQKVEGCSSLPIELVLEFWDISSAE